MGINPILKKRNLALVSIEMNSVLWPAYLLDIYNLLVLGNDKFGLSFHTLRRFLSLVFIIPSCLGNDKFCVSFHGDHFSTLERLQYGFLLTFKKKNSYLDRTLNPHFLLYVQVSYWSIQPSTVFSIEFFFVLVPYKSERCYIHYLVPTWMVHLIGRLNVKKHTWLMSRSNQLLLLLLLLLLKYTVKVLYCI